MDSSTMKTSDPPTPSTIQSDFAPSWSNSLNTTIPSNPELAIIEYETWKNEVYCRDNLPTEPTATESNLNNTSPPSPELAIVENHAWKDQFYFREYAPTTPLSLDAPALWRKARQVEMAKQGVITPPPTPRKNEREYDEESSDEEETEDKDEEADADMWLSSYTDEQRALIKYGPRHGFWKEEGRLGVGNAEQQVEDFGKKIMFYVFLAVLLHGIYIHWNESQKPQTVTQQAIQYLTTTTITSTITAPAPPAQTVTSTVPAPPPQTVTSVSTTPCHCVHGQGLGNATEPGNATGI
jgi:hypothetical protein